MGRSSMPDFQKDPVSYLVERRFPRGPIVRAIRHERKSLRPLPGQAPVKDAVDAAIAYRAELSKLPPSELAARCTAEREKEIAEILAGAKREEEARVFNQPYARADFEYWAKAAHWSLDEAIALSFGKGPEYVNWKAIEPLVRISPFALEYQRRRELALRAVPWNQLFDPVPPSIFLDWAKKLQVAVPPELEAAVTAVGSAMMDWKALYDDLQSKFEGLLQTFQHSRTSSNELRGKSMELIEEYRTYIDRLLAKIEAQKQKLAAAQAPTGPAEKGLATRERESLLRLVIGMAVGGYGFDPAATRSRLTSEIAGDLERAGLSVHPDTVRKWLKEAAELLPPP